MQPEFVTDSLLLETAWAVGILVVSIIIAWLIRFVIRFIKGRLQKRLKSDLFPQILHILTRPVFLIIVLEGLILALGTLSYLAHWSSGLTGASIAIAIVLVTTLWHGLPACC